MFSLVMSVRRYVQAYEYIRIQHDFHLSFHISDTIQIYTFKTFNIEQYTGESISMFGLQDFQTETRETALALLHKRLWGQIDINI